jgi:hypothetical protein
MKNDFKLLPLQHLAREYQETFQEAYSKALEHEAKILQAAWQRKYDQTLARLQELNDNSEAGSDGLLEEAMELCGKPPKPAISSEVVAKLRTTSRIGVLQPWMEREGISQKLSWLPQQMMAYFGSWEAVRVDGVYSPALTVKRNTQERNDLYALGALMLAKAPRSDFFKGAPKGSQQYKSPINPLVPIVLAGFKRYQNIPYEAWDKSEIPSIVDDEIALLVGCKVPSLSDVDILAIRNTALTPKTGARAGKSNNPATTASLYHLQESAIGHLPKLARHMVLQTWAAHPQNRDPYAILDPENWDKVPDPLVEGTDLFLPPESQPSKRIVTGATTYADMPWV